ncbi:hypothetical protein [Ornithinibacillus halotolerans]|uniref:Uncharacterized protein n=1 Tax=Ornithinibacillus halotolerans TaxID=1274357 RepID=A0A916RP90_9BACI|nr:hypothetical protein [Ornithinibacillus halotolerans]GGA63573.1 hypothetical protein GCM10008025_04320 [Ornithinibacillus halotolerans]
MLRRKITSIIVGSIIGLMLLVLMSAQIKMNLPELISYIFQLLPFAFPFIVLYGGTVTLLSDYIAKRYDGHKRLLTAFLIHLGFGLLFGIIVPSNIDVSILGLHLDMFLIAATLVAISIWGIDELIRLKEFNNRFTLFTTGLILFIITIPFTVFVTLEEIKEKEFIERYTISRGQQFSGIEIVEEIQENQTAKIDHWKNQIMIGDITVLLKDNMLVQLEDSPIRIDWEGIDRYYGQLSIFRITDYNDKSEKFIVMMMSSEDDLSYTYYEINETGEVKEDAFHYEDRSHYETFLLNNSSLAISYTNYYGEGYHTPAFPVSTFISVILIGMNWPRRRVR